MKNPPVRSYPSRGRRITLPPFSYADAARIVSDVRALGVPGCPACGGALVIEGPLCDAWDFRCPTCRRRTVVHYLALEGVQASERRGTRRAV